MNIYFVYVILLHTFQAFPSNAHDLVIPLSRCISIAQCKTAVTPLLMHWSYCSLVLSHRYVLAACYNTSYFCMLLSQMPMICKIIWKHLKKGKHHLKIPNENRHMHISLPWFSQRWLTETYVCPGYSLKWSINTQFKINGHAVAHGE